MIDKFSCLLFDKLLMFLGMVSRESSVSSASSPQRTAFEDPRNPEASSGASGSSFTNISGQSDFERMTLVSIISPSVHQAQLLSSFINSITVGNPAKIAPAYNCHSVWMSEMAGRPEISSTLLWSIRAISLSHLGRQIGDESLINNSRTMYGRALLRLNKALEDPMEGLTSDTLSATVLLSFYELLTCTERNSWVRHAGGAGNLMRLRGPDRHRSGFDATIFLACRYTIITEAYQSRKPCFLASPAWRQLSWELSEQSPLQGPFHTAREEIFQETVQYPGYISESMEYLSTSRYDAPFLRELIRQGQRHRHQYKILQARLTAALRENDQEPKLVPSPTNDEVFPEIYKYTGNLVGSYFCGYWSILVMLNIVLISLESKFSELATPDPRSLSTPNPRSLSHSPNPTLAPPEIFTRGNTSPTSSIGPVSLNFWQLLEQTRRKYGASTPGSPTIGTPSGYPSMSDVDITQRRHLYMAENIRCARDTCRSVESMSMSMFLGPMFLVLALRMSLRVLTDEVEKHWILEKLDDISKIFGLARTEKEIFLQQKRMEG